MRKAQPDRANKNAKIVEAAHRPQPSEIRWLRSARERNGGKKKNPPRHYLRKKDFSKASARIFRRRLLHDSPRSGGKTKGGVAAVKERRASWDSFIHWSYHEIGRTLLPSTPAPRRFPPQFASAPWDETVRSIPPLSVTGYDYFVIPFIPGP